MEQNRQANVRVVSPCGYRADDELGGRVRQPGAVRSALLDAFAHCTEIGHFGVALRVQQHVCRLRRESGITVQISRL